MCFPEFSSSLEVKQSKNIKETKSFTLKESRINEVNNDFNKTVF